MPKKPKSLNFQFWRYTTNLDLRQHFLGSDLH